MPPSNRDRGVANEMIVGAVAGLFASFVMDKFQALLMDLRLQPTSGDDPSTVKLAERLVGHEIPERQKSAAGNLVHYSFGAVLGSLYGASAAFEPNVTSGFGTVYGAVVALVVDEGVIPAIGLSGPPWRASAATHAYSLVSHCVFGVTLEGTRRALKRGALGQEVG